MGVGEVVGVVLLLGFVCLCWLVFRRFRLVRAGGVEVALRRYRASAPHSTRGWNIGVLRYQGDQGAWFRVIGLSRGPEVRLNRLVLEITDRRRPGPSEEAVIPPDATVLRCRDDGRIYELAMTPDVLTGFLSWLESTLPGRFGDLRAS